MQAIEAATEGVPVMCMPNLISNLSSKSSHVHVVSRTFISEWLQKNPHAAVAWLSMELPVGNRKYNLHTIIQLEEMNFATTK